MAIELLIRGGARNFPTGGLTLPTKGLKYGFQVIVNAKNLRQNSFSPSNEGASMFRQGAIAPSSPTLKSEHAKLFLLHSKKLRNLWRSKYLAIYEQTKIESLICFSKNLPVGLSSTAFFLSCKQLITLSI